MNELLVLSETLIHISPAIVAFASILALGQLWIAKKDIHTRSKREAVCMAAEKCETVAKEILPMYQRFFVPNQDKMKLGTWSLRNDDFSANSMEKPEEGRKWVDDLKSNDYFIVSLDFLNRLEGLAMYFANGAADEKVAFSAIGSVFCYWVEQFAPILIQVREDSISKTTSGPFQNTVDLYKVWAVRMKRSRIQNEIDALSARLSASKSTEIKPIGVE